MYGHLNLIAFHGMRGFFPGIYSFPPFEKGRLGGILYKKIPLDPPFSKGEVVDSVLNLMTVRRSHTDGTVNEVLLILFLAKDIVRIFFSYGMGIFSVQWAELC